MATAAATAPALVWVGRDLRLRDNPALSAAVQSGQPLVLVYIHEENTPYRLTAGAASGWWLHRSIERMSAALKKLGARLHLIQGDAEFVLPHLVQKHGITDVFWNQITDPKIDDRDRRIAQSLMDIGTQPRVFRSITLLDAGQVLNKSGQPFRVFTPFWRAASATIRSNRLAPEPKQIQDAGLAIDGSVLEDWGLIPSSPNWAEGFEDDWVPGERGAQTALDRFLHEALNDSPENRDRPDLNGTSRLSPHLNFGEISPRQVWIAARDAEARGAAPVAVEKFLAEIGWREFSYYLFHHFGDLRQKNFNPKFNNFAWRDDAKGLRAWTKGQTGIPMVDAGMRQLWQTGWMHNRVRMITASFLVKHLGIHWQDGMRWFEDTLVDADPLVNATSWQWVAGTGADAAPYFRIFNPVTQGQKFDPNGDYVRRWVPELSALRGKDIHAPSEAPPAVLLSAGVEIGRNYPAPIVDLKQGRQAALDAFAALKAADSLD